MSGYENEELKQDWEYLGGRHEPEPRSERPSS